MCLGTSYAYGYTYGHVHTTPRVYVYTGLCEVVTVPTNRRTYIPTYVVQDTYIMGTPAKPTQAEMLGRGLPKHTQSHSTVRNRIVRAVAHNSMAPCHPRARATSEMLTRRGLHGLHRPNPSFMFHIPAGPWPHHPSNSQSGHKSPPVLLTTSQWGHNLSSVPSTTPANSQFGHNFALCPRDLQATHNLVTFPPLCPSQPQLTHNLVTSRSVSPSTKNYRTLWSHCGRRLARYPNTDQYMACSQDAACAPAQSQHAPCLWWVG